MTLRSTRLSPISTLPATGLAVALALGCLVGTPASAARLGYTRVVSAQNAPLQMLVGITDLTPDEQDSLSVTLADDASWQRAGLTPPVPLSSIKLQVENGSDRTRKNVRLTSTEVARSPAVDLLLNLGSGAGQRQVQVTVMQAAGGFPGLTSQATVGASGRGSRSSGSVGVKQGDTLYGIAQSNAIADATIYQMLVALWRANPQAFLQNNMNLVKAGATLVVPDAATVRAVDPAEARRIFLEQAQAYARYRASLANAAGRGAAAAGTPADSGQVGSAPVVPTPAPPAEDRLRLSSGQPGQGDAQAQAQTRGDQEASTARATRDAENRVGELQRNVNDLNAALASSRGQGGAANNPVQGNAQANNPAGVAGANSASPGGVASSASSAAGQSGQSTMAPGTSAPGIAAPSGSPSAGQAATSAQQPGAGAPVGSTASGAGGTSDTGGTNSSSGANNTNSTNSTTGANGAAAGANNGVGATNGAASAASNGAGAPGGAAAGANAGAPANNAAPGTANTQAASGAGATPGIAGDASSLGGSPGTAGAPGSSSAAPASPGTSAAGGTGVVPGTGGPSAGSTAGDATKSAPEPAGTATAAPGKTDGSGLPSWLTDNLLIVVTGVLALIAFVIAWLLRRAGARREEEQDDMDEETYLSEMDPALIDRRLENINLDLDQSPGEHGRREPGSARV
jgi:pilus assembly protein FimV